jgi:Tol biopolymer transport system component
MTQAGMILGTAAYMAPEQAKGRPVDRRADIWAFGAVLFEMLAGTRAFAGEDVSETLANVLKTDPAWERLPADVPAPVRQVLRSCLQRDAKQRLGDMQSVRLALEGAFEMATAPTASATASASRGRVAWMVAAAAVVGMIALALPAVRYLRQSPPPTPPETRVDLVTPATDQPTDFALSPDGGQIVFVASGDGASRLWRRSLATTTAQPLAGTEGAQFPFWSPDSPAVAFFADGQLKRVDLGGGAPQTVAAASAIPRGGTWNANGVILFAPTSGGPRLRVPASGGAPVAVTTLAGQQGSHRWPSFLPDGRHFLFYAQGAPDTVGIYLGTLDAPDTHRLTAADAAGVSWASPSVAADGWLLWVRAGTLVAQRLDVAGAALTGDPVTLADAVAVDVTLNAAAVSVSASGLVAYRTSAGSRRQLTWVDRSGKALGPLGAPDENNLLYPSVSPDGQQVAVVRTVQGNTDIWLLDGARASRFTFDAAVDRYPLWSPDGTRIAFDSNRTGTRDLYLTAAGGAGAEERLLASPQTKVATDWSADGRFLLYYSIDPQTNRDLWVLPLEGDRTPWVLLKTPFDERHGAFSPDGRWVAYQSNESGRDEIYIRPFGGAAASGADAAAAGRQWQVSTVGGVFPRWRRDGKELYYLAPNGALMAAPITVTGATLAPGAPVALFPIGVYGGGVDIAQNRQYDVTRDGRFLINTVLDEAAAPITLIQNWNPEAKK